MIHLINFEKEFVGKEFTDLSQRTTYTCVGYGDNGSKGNPYLVGMYNDGGKIGFLTVLLNHVKIIPKP